MGYDIYTGLLKAFPLPKESMGDVHLSYDYDNPQLVQLKTAYLIDSIAGVGNDFSKAVNLLYWVSDHLYHKGDYYNSSVAPNSLALLDYAFDKGRKHGINCVSLAKILSECLLSIGIKARSVYLMPCSPYDGDNHVVTHVFIREMNKWVMLDPTFRGYFSNQQNEYLSLFELRDHLADQKAVFFNQEAKYNHNALTKKKAKEGIAYYAKNLFYFRTAEISTFGRSNDSSNDFIALCPACYDPKLIRLSNIEYRLRQFGENPNMHNWIDDAKKEQYRLCGISDFER